MIVKLKKIARNFYLYIIGKSLYLKNTVKFNHDWFGNEYGGFYVYPDQLDENSIVYSFGIGEDISFDLQLIKTFNCKVYGFDPTPKSINWIKSQQLSSLFCFNDYGIGKQTGLVTFYLPKNVNHVSGSVFALSNLNEFEPIEVLLKKFSDIQLNHKVIDVLKMDIEGAEYDIISSIVESDIIVKQILIEFHHRMFDNGAKLTRDSILLLRNYGYELFAYSDTMEELSFINLKYV